MVSPAPLTTCVPDSTFSTLGHQVERVEEVATDQQCQTHGQHGEVALHDHAVHARLQQLVEAIDHLALQAGHGTHHGRTAGDQGGCLRLGGYRQPAKVTARRPGRGIAVASDRVMLLRTAAPSGEAAREANQFGARVSTCFVHLRPMRAGT
jgi:hypothetical protein